MNINRLRFKVRKIKDVYNTTLPVTQWREHWLTFSSLPVRSHSPFWRKPARHTLVLELVVITDTKDGILVIVEIEYMLMDCVPQWRERLHRRGSEDFQAWRCLYRLAWTCKWLTVSHLQNQWFNIWNNFSPKDAVLRVSLRGSAPSEVRSNSRSVKSRRMLLNNWF